jgi:ribosomal protein S18 acetylase RimI-like enzyme
MDIRPLTLNDATPVAQLLRRFERFWKVPLVTPDEQMREELAEPFLDLEKDTRGCWMDDALVAYGRIWHRPSGERLERAYLFGVVDPSFRGQGIGRHLFGWEMDRATEILEQCDPALPRFIRADDWDWIEDSHHLYQRFGLKPVRYFEDMIRPLPAEVEVHVPQGVDIIPFERSHDEATRVAWNEAFSDHWGSTPIDADSYRHRIEMEGTKEELSYLAAANGEVIGLVLNGIYPEDFAVTGRREGWIEVLGVKPPWRGRGVAKALLRTSFNAFFAKGLSHAALNVDSANPTGAFGLYAGQGFEPTAGSITYEIRL